MPAARTRPARRSAAGVLAAVSGAAVLALSACDTSESAPPGGGSGHEGGHSAPHSGPHPAQHHTPAPPSGEFDPRNCPTGLVC